MTVGEAWEDRDKTRITWLDRPGEPAVDLFCALITDTDPEELLVQAILEKQCECQKGLTLLHDA